MKDLLIRVVGDLVLVPVGLALLVAILLRLHLLPLINGLLRIKVVSLAKISFYWIWFSVLNLLRLRLRL